NTQPDYGRYSGNTSSEKAMKKAGLSFANVVLYRNRPFKMKMRLLLLFACWSMLSCEKADGIDPGDYHRGDLIETVKKGSLTVEEIIGRVTELDAHSFA